MALLNALEDQEAAEVAVDLQLDAAIAKWTKGQSYGLYAGINFSDWLADGNAPSYDTANDELTRTSAVVDDISSIINGPKAKAKMADVQRLKNGRDQTRSIVG